MLPLTCIVVQGAVFPAVSFALSTLATALGRAWDLVSRTHSHSGAIQLRSSSAANDTLLLHCCSYFAAGSLYMQLYFTSHESQLFRCRQLVHAIVLHKSQVLCVAVGCTLWHIWLEYFWEEELWCCGAQKRKEARWEV
eukprot:817649-Pelagomonas_calceolata.AAC.1